MPFLAILGPFWPISGQLQARSGATSLIFGTVRSRFGERSGFCESLRVLTSTQITSKHRNIAPTDRFDPRLYPPKNANFGDFGAILAVLGYFGPFWAQKGVTFEGTFPNPQNRHYEGRT